MVGLEWMHVDDPVYRFAMLERRHPYGLGHTVRAQHPRDCDEGRRCGRDGLAPNADTGSQRPDAADQPGRNGQQQEGIEGERETGCCPRRS